MEILDVAHPALTLVLVVALLVVLGLLQNLDRRLRVAEHRLESMEREQKLYDQALAEVSHSAPAESTAQSGPRRSLREEIADMQQGSTPAP